MTRAEVSGPAPKSRTQVPGVGTIDDHQIQISAGYAFESGLSADLGWKRSEDAGIETDTIGFLFAYGFGF